jgi:AAA15 family ATPase/GTPase
MVFIGPQASGKSTIAKLVYFFKSLFPFVTKELANQLGFDDLKTISNVNYAFDVACWKYLGEILGSSINYIKDDTELSFKYTNNESISTYKSDISKGQIALPFLFDKKGEFNPLFNSISHLNATFDFSDKSQVFKLSKGFLNDKTEFENRTSEIFKELTNLSTFGSEIFIPDNKSNFACNNNEINNYIEGRFRDEINDARYTLSSFNFDYKRLTDLSLNVLKGHYTYDEGDHLILSNDEKVDIEDASSGQKEALWIIQLVKIFLRKRKSSFTTIEEPEAHLFPSSQKSLAEIISLLSNSNDNQIFITTHSPYILAAINNLMQAYKTGQDHPEKTNEIIDKELWLDPKRVSAYFVGGEGNEGEIRNILDKELNSIAIEEIDSITEVFNSDYDKLTDLEYNVVS